MHSTTLQAFVRAKDQIRRLDELGFVWNKRDAAWEKMFIALVVHRDKYGHCNVPAIWPENRKLATWVKTQRRIRKDNKLDEDRFHRLDKLGFEWNPHDALGSSYNT